MTGFPFDNTARAVVAEYALDGPVSWTTLGNAGGFSGARLWRGQRHDGTRLCLREWPNQRTTEDRLMTIHRAMRVLARLPFVPKLCETRDGSTWVDVAGESLWEMTTWMPGVADFNDNPNDARLFAAMRALAQMHERMRAAKPVTGPCPAVKRILRAMRGWRDLLQSGWKPDFRFPRPEPIPALARRAWQAISAGTYSIEFTLVNWEDRQMPLQMCLCDIWHDHILYEKDQLTGVIDYGAVKPDCVAIDLARLLGSMIPEQRERMRQAFAVYSAIHPTPEVVFELAAILDQAGAIVGLTNWLRWLYHEQRSYLEGAAVGRRLEALTKRVETATPTPLGAWA